MEPVMVDENVTIADVLTGRKVIPIKSSIKDEISALTEEIDALKAESSQLFGLEKARKEEIQLQVRELKAKLRPLEATFLLEQEKLNSYINLDCLYMRNKESQLPVFVLFSLSYPVFLISSNWTKPTHRSEFELRDANILLSETWDCSKCVDHPLDVLRKAYWDVLKEGIKICQPENGEYRGNASTTRNLKVMFSGSIPSSTRRKIQQSQDLTYGYGYKHKLFDEGIYILTEVSKWEISSEAIGLVKVDPLVVGACSRFPDKLFVIDVFDITPLENTIPIAIE